MIVIFPGPGSDLYRDTLKFLPGASEYLICTKISNWYVRKNCAGRPDIVSAHLWEF